MKYFVSRDVLIYIFENSNLNFFKFNELNLLCLGCQSDVMDSNMLWTWVYVR